MDRKGWERTVSALGADIIIDPIPSRSGEDIQFFEMRFEPPITPSEVLNKLGNAGLSGLGAEASGPNLKAGLQSFDPHPQRPTHHLTFEDLHHPNSLG